MSGAEIFPEGTSVGQMKAAFASLQDSNSAEVSSAAARELVQLELMPGADALKPEEAVLKIFRDRYTKLMTLDALK